MHFMRWMLLRLTRERKVVSMVVTSSPHEERAGWHNAQEARVSLECGA